MRHKSSEFDKDELANKKLQERIGTEKRGGMLVELADYEIERIHSELKLLDTSLQIAKAIYRRALGEKVVENATVSRLCAASSYAAIRVESKPYSLSDVSKHSKSGKDEIARTFASLSSELKLEVGPVQPQHYVSRFCDELGLGKIVETKATDIIDECVEKRIHSGKSPSAFAASSVYIASLLVNERTTQREIGDVADVSSKTIRNLYQQQIYSIAPEIAEDSS